MRQILSVVFLSAFVFAFAAQADETTLPNARAEIDASQFQTLQAALDAVSAEGGIVRLPAGTFDISEPLLVTHGDVRVVGAGSATNIVNKNTDGKPALVIRHRDGAEVKKNERLWRVSLADFRITGNEKSGHGIEAIQIEEIFIHGVSVSYNGGDGIRLDHCYEDPRVSDCLLTYNKSVGLNLLGCHDIIVSANQFEENQDALHCKDGFNLCMTGNCLDDHLGGGVLIENTYGSVLSGNMIEECAGTAITLDRDCYGITLGSNVIAHNGAGIDMKDGHGCAISANTFTIMKDFALRVGPNSSRLAITGNSFCNSYTGDGKIRRKEGDRDAGGLVLDSTTAISLTGNLFSGLSTHAVTNNGESTKIVQTGNGAIDTLDDQ